MIFQSPITKVDIFASITAKWSMRKLFSHKDFSFAGRTLNGERFNVTWLRHIRLRVISIFGVDVRLVREFPGLKQNCQSGRWHS